MRSVPVLMYHHVSPAPGLVTVSPPTFAAHMEMLVRKGYTTLDPGTLLAFLEGRGSAPEKSVVITFDDGYLDNYIHAYPVLRRLGLRAIIFAVTGWIGDQSLRDANASVICPDHRTCKAAIREGRADSVMLRWSEIEEMESSGVLEVHSHTHTHVRWDQLYPTHSEALAQLQNDLEQSRLILQTHLGKRDYHLCWPWGKFDEAYQTIAQSLGFAAQYSVDPSPNVSGDGATHVGRIAVKEASSAWLARRLWLYSAAGRALLYNRVAGKHSAYG